MSRQDIRQDVTDRVIAALEKGGLAEWTRPWAKAAGIGGAMPWNFSTGKTYQGVNVVMLFMEAIDRNYSSNAWLTFNQAKALGGKVRKGESGTAIVSFRLMEKPSKAPDAGADDTVMVPFARQFFVFNVDQCEGLDLGAMMPRPILDTDGKLALVEALGQRLCKETGMRFQRVGDRACYSPSLDLLKMPAGEWASVEDYSATLAHELVHATGAPHRLNRREGIYKRFEDSRQAYAMEELCAELGAAMVCAEFGIVGENLQHESYIASWLEALKNDKTYIFKAAALASEAHRYMMGEVIEAKTDLSVDEAA